MDLTPEQRFVAATMARQDLYWYARYTFRASKGYPWMRASHHPVICNALMRVYRGETKRLIINVPPRYSKTELAVKDFISWGIGKAPDAEFIHTSYSARLAGANSWAARELVVSPTYREIFPELRLRDDSQARDEWRTSAGGVIYATGSGGSITGYGAGKMRPGFGGCFPYDQLVETEIGPIAIGDLVTKRLPVRVWSFNETTGRAELRPVDTFWTNPPNDILEVGLSDGASFRCTPNHRLLTSAGWIEARNLADSLDLVDRKPGLGRRLLSRFRRVGRDLDRLLRVLRLRAPDRVGQVLRDARPGLPQLDLADHAGPNAEGLCEIAGRQRASEDSDGVIASQLGAGTSLQDRKRPEAERVLHVVGLRAPSKVAQSVVPAVAVKVAGLVARGARALKRLQNKVCNVAHLDLPTDGKVDPEIALAIVTRLDLAGGVGPADTTKVGDLIQASGPSYVKPSFVRHVGHEQTTFCLEIRENHNFILSGSGAIVSNCIIIDDPHKADEARSDTIRKGVIEWFQNTLESRKNSRDTPIILIMQRLHEEDLAGWLLAGGNGEKWEQVGIPALQADGTALWPEKHSVEMLKRMQDAAPYIFSGQYQQEPTPTAGAVIKPDRIGVVESLPMEGRWVRAWDLAATQDDGDWTVGALLCATPGGRYIVCDITRLQGGPESVIEAIVAAAKRDPRGTKISIPQDPGQAGKSQVLYFAKALAGFNVTASPESGDKVTRAEPFAAQVNLSLVDMVKSDWNMQLVTELRYFPFGKHDDQVDALSRAFGELIESVGGAEWLNFLAGEVERSKAAPEKKVIPHASVFG